MGVLFLSAPAAGCLYPHRVDLSQPKLTSLRRIRSTSPAEQAKWTASAASRFHSNVPHRQHARVLNEIYFGYFRLELNFVGSLTQFAPTNCFSYTLWRSQRATPRCVGFVFFLFICCRYAFFYYCLCFPFLFLLALLFSWHISLVIVIVSVMIILVWFVAFNSTPRRLGQCMEVQRWHLFTCYMIYVCMYVCM